MIIFIASKVEATLCEKEIILYPNLKSGKLKM